MLLNLQHAFFDHYDINTQWGSATLIRKSLGKLNLPTGRIIAVDPFIFSNEKPFTETVKPGFYEVYVSIAKFNGDERIAYASIIFNMDEVKRWELAITKDQDTSKLLDDEIYGYGVDSGTGCFFDEKTSESFLNKMNKNEDYFQTLIDNMESSYVDTRSFMNIEIKDKMNLIAFSSGLGDGVYASYFGKNDKEEVCCLVTDFCVVE